MASAAICEATSPAAAPPIPSQTSNSAPLSPTGKVKGSRPSAARTAFVMSATRKLSSLCSRISPTSVLPKTSIAMSGGLGIRRPPSSYLEPQQLVAHSDEVARIQAVGPPQAQERPIRAAQILQVPASVSERNLGVPPRHELVVGEDEVPGLATEHHVGAGEVEDVARDRSGGDLPEAGPGRAHRGPEHHHPVLERRPQVPLGVGQKLEAQHLLADQQVVAVLQIDRTPQAYIDAVAVLERRQHPTGQAGHDARVARRQVGVLEEEIALGSADVDLIAEQ